MDKIKDLGIVFDCRLKFREHIDAKINRAYQMLGIIKRNFIHLTLDSFVVLYKSILRSHLEYSECVWNPHHQQLIEQEAQLMLTTGSTRLAVSRGQQTWYHSTCYI